ncbi:MAG: IS21 family transposase [Solirubrobacterales bacterium]
MLAEEEHVEIVALRRRGWTISAIARHSGCDRKTVRAWLKRPREGRRERPSALEPFRGYVGARFADDPHLPATVLWRELVELGFERSYQTLTRELRRLGLRPRCEACRRGGPDLTTEIEHPPGEELQIDWWELCETPWGEPAYVLVGTLPHSGRVRGVFCDGMTFAHLAGALDALLRRFGGTARRWRIDRMSTAVIPGTDRLRAEFAELARHYGVGVSPCPPRRARRKGSVESGNRYLGQSWWRSAQVRTPAEAQASLDRFCRDVGDQRPRPGGQTVAELAELESLLALPAALFPAELRTERKVDRTATVAFEGNRYGVGAEHAGQLVTVSAVLGEPELRILGPAGSVLAIHRRAPAGSGQLLRSAEQRAELEQAVLAAFTTRPPCRRKQNRPPGEAALAEAARLRGHSPQAPAAPDLDRYAELAELAR